MKDDPNTELITHGMVFNFGILQINHLWGHKSRCTAPTEQILLHIDESCQSKISDANVFFAHVIGSKQNIFWLKVSMHDVAFMTMIDSF